MAQEAYTKQHSGSLIDEVAGSLLNQLTDTQENRPNGWVVDAKWVRQSFIVNTDGSGAARLEDVDRANRSFSSADLKYTDSSLGGNTVINPPPQFTRFADPPARGIIPNANDQVSLGLMSGHIGMGPYYSEAIDDNSQVIHLRFGTVQFNSLTQFFTGFYSSSMGAAARTGRFTDDFFTGVLRAGAKLLALALVPLAIIPVAILMAGSAVRFFLNWPSSKFCTMKPAMELYWNAVTSMVNQIGSNQGLVTYMDPAQAKSILGKGQVIDNRQLSVLTRMTDGLITETGGIDVFKLSTRAKRLEMNYDAARAAMLESAGDTEFFGVVKRSMDYKTQGAGKTVYDNQSASLESLLDRYFKSGKKQSNITGDDASKQTIESDPKKITITDTGAQAYSPPEADDGFMSYFLANLGDGADYVSFRVDYTGPVQESFSNNTVDSSLAGKINGMAATQHDIRMNFAGAVESIPGLSTVLDGVKTVLGTVASTLHLEGLAAVGGSAFVDIPQHWESSIAQLPKMNYTMTLISPYGNPVSRMFSMFIPLSMILAGGLPLSTGKQSHTSPFLVELHDQGRSMTRMGIIDSISISRGTSNLGFNNEGQPMAIEVSFGIKDLSTIMSLPIHPGFGDQPLAGLFEADGENPFTDYLMTLAGMSLRDQIYRLPVLKYQWRRTMAGFDTFTSKAAFASYMANMPGVNSLSAMMRGISR